MSQPYRLYGADVSPFSIKVRRVLQFKQLEHSWLQRTAERAEEMSKYAQAPLLPVLVGADDEVLQDSTPTIETLERRHPEPAITPDDPALAFLSELIEDYADEWVNKALHYYRWSFEADQISACHRISEAAGIDDRSAAETRLRERMATRVQYVGATPANGPVLEQSLVRLLEILQAHLETRSYLFGGRPALADFGLGAQLAQLCASPTPSAIFQARAPRLLAYVARMEAPTIEGAFEPIEQLERTLAPLLKEEIAECFLPWMSANALAAHSGDRVSLELPGGLFEQACQRLASRAFQEIRRKRAIVSDEPVLGRLLGESGCDAFLLTTDAEAEAEADAGAEDSDGESDGAEDGATDQES